MSTSPINGYFKQLEDYYVAQTARAHGSTGTRTPDQLTEAYLPEDRVMLSSEGVGAPRPVRPPNAYCYLDTLTDSDKAIVKAATGWDIDADPLGSNAPPDAKAFVGRLNLDRASGVLTGEIDKAYLDNVIAQQLNGQGMVSLSVLFKAEAYLSKEVYAAK